jgi:peroxiredoxin
MAELQKGTHAPHLKLFDTDRKAIDVPVHGEVSVLVFFPAAFTSVCTTEVCTFRDQLAAFNQFNAKVYGISVDSPFSLAEFKKQQNLNFSLLSDHKHEAIRAFDIVFPDLAGVGFEAAKRSVFVIGKDGNLAWKWIADNPGQQPNYDEVKKAVEAISK